MKKLFLILFFPLGIYSMFSYSNPHEHHKERESKKLKDELYELESHIFYKRHLSPLNTIREGTAFIVAVSGILGSLVTPFKLVKKDTRHPMSTFAQRASVGAATFFAAITAAYTISYVRPIISWYEYKKDRLKHKIFELEKI